MRTLTRAWPVVVSGALLCQCFGSSNSGSEAAQDAGAPDVALVEAASPDAATPLPFQLSNVTFAEVLSQAPMAMAENVTGSCMIKTDPSAPEDDCFSSPITVVTQSGGGSVSFVVVASLTLAAGAVVRVTGPVPLVLVSLGDITLNGSIDAHSADLNLGAGGAAGADSNAVGNGTGGGSAGSSTAPIGGSGGSFCGLGGHGGGATPSGTPAMSYGNPDIRPLAGGSAGGGGSVGSGAGGGALEIVAGGTLSLSAGSSINAGGEGGPFAGLAADQNAGGGGSGGAILLEATTVSMAGTLAANGGGGGGDYTSADGADATASAMAAAGGAGGTSGAAGGNGSAGSTASGSAGMAGASLNSGGGGGGAGWIRINTASGMAAITGTLSPAQGLSCTTVDTVRAAGSVP
jgi:hypothetical protein